MISQSGQENLMIGSQLVLVMAMAMEEVSQGVDSEVAIEQEGVVIKEQRVVVPQVGHLYQSKTTLSLKGSLFVLSANRSTLHINVIN